MSKTTQIRNLPDALHRKLKSRAAMAGMALSGYLLAEIRASAARPTPYELRARLESRSAVNPAISPAEAIAQNATVRDRHRRISLY